MSDTGTYVASPQGLIKVSDEIPSLARPIYAPKGDLPHYDPSAQQHFQSKAHKRAWMQQNGLREGGLINPDKRLEGHWKNASKPSLSQRKERQAVQAMVQAQGGTEGLLAKFSKGVQHVG